MQLELHFQQVYSESNVGPNQIVGRKTEKGTSPKCSKAVATKNYSMVSD